MVVLFKESFVDALMSQKQIGWWRHIRSRRSMLHDGGAAHGMLEGREEMVEMVEMIDSLDRCVIIGKSEIGRRDRRVNPP